MAYIGNKPTDVPLDATDIADGTITNTQINASAAIATTKLAAGNIAFPATQSASADANTLDDYEEGSWTPVLSDGSNNATTSIGVGRYEKIGRLVFWRCYLVTSSLGSVTGALRITGLPFTSSSDTNALTPGYCGTSQGYAVTGGQNASAYVGANESFARVILWDSTVGTTAMDATEWSADGGGVYGGHYAV